MQSKFLKASLRAFVSLLLASTVVVSFSTPFLTRYVGASPLARHRAGKGPSTLLPTASIRQSSGRQSEALLTPSGSSVAQQKQDNGRPSAITQKVRLPQEKDRPPVEIALTPTARRSPSGVGSSAVVTLSVVSHVNIESSTLGVAVAGGASSPALARSEWRSAQRSRSLLPDITVKQESERDFGPLKAGEKKELPIEVRFTAPGVGYLVAAVRSPSRGAARISEAATLYFLVADSTVYWSAHSVLDLREQQLRVNLKKENRSEEEIQKRVERLRRSGGGTRKKVSPPSKQSAAITSDPDTYNSVTVEGTVLFTDVSGNTHPVRFATVQIFDEEAGVDELVDTTSTDAAGHYSSTVDDNDGDGTGRDFFVVAVAQGDTVAVEDFADADSIWSIDSLPAQPDVADGSTLTIDLTANNNLGNANNVAFEVYEAVNALSRYLTNLGEPLPALVTMRYPGPTDTSSYSPSTQKVSTGGTDVHDWDNLHHEYAHHIQHLFNIENSPGGAHSLASNLCSIHGKDAGLRLSWSEGWATFFSIMGQRELNLATLAIPNLGDTSYTDTKPMGPATTYDLEPSGACADSTCLGESDEIAAQRALWDFYDPANDDGDTVAFTAQVMWDTVTNDHSDTFSQFWRALIFSRTEAQKAALGEILQDHGIGTAPTNPATGTTFSGGAAPNFQWTGNLECDTGGNARFSFRAYTSDFGSLIWASPWQPPTNLTPTNAQRDQIFVGPNAALRWLVTSRDTTAPETGAYYGSSSVINDDFAVPDRSPVDLILALDVSASMNSSVPGSTTGFTKIQLLQQAAEVFLQTWRLHRVDGDRIGVVYLNSNTSSVPGAPPVLRDLATEVDAVITDIRGKGASGCTAVGGALQVGFNSFDAGSMNKRVMILFTDGMQSINPFVGEEGGPARLKIMSFAPASTLPFGAFFCSNDTANDLTGADIVPDGQFLDDHSVQIHTIGVGVDGADFTGFVQRIADETTALHHFTSAPDEELDIFYTNDLVNSLKTASLEVVGTSSGSLAANGTKTLLVPVNESAISLTLVLSWKGQGQGDVGMIAKAPGGQVIDPSEVRQSGFYRIVKIKLPATAKGTTVPSAGNWTVELTGTRGGRTNYQLSAIVDEPCFHYQFKAPHRAIAAGERALLTVALSQQGKPVLKADGIFVEVTRPEQSIGNLLAEWLPRTKAGAEPFAESKAQTAYEKTPQEDPRKSAFNAALAEVYKDPTFIKSARAKANHRVLLVDDGDKEHGDATAGDGIYSGYLVATQVPGSYALRLFVQASSRCGRVTRTESTATLVEVAPADPRKSVLIAVPAANGAYAIMVAPADRFGNLLGPGNPTSIEVYAKGTRPVSELRDRLDGSYEQLIAVERGTNPKVTVLVNGKQLATVPLQELLSNGKTK